MEINEFKPNSNRSKEAKPEKNVEKVVTGKVRQVRNKEIKKIKDVMFPGDLNLIGKHVLIDVVAPYAKKTLSDLVNTAMDILLYGESQGHRGASTKASKVSYQRYYDSKETKSTTMRPSAYSRSAYNYNDVVLETRGEAEEVLIRMDELMETYGMVSVGDMYDLCGITPEFTDNNYGWKDIHAASVVAVRDGFLIKMPPAMPLD